MFEKEKKKSEKVFEKHKSEYLKFMNRSRENSLDLAIKIREKKENK